MRTDSTIANNKPDIIMCDNNKGTSMFIFAAVHWNRNVMTKVAEKI
jgi:hypothetical protein